MATHSSTLAWKILHGGAWQAAVHGVAESRTWLSGFPFTFHFHALEKEMATHSSVLAWRIPGTAEPGGLQSVGSHGVGHDWSDLAAAAAVCVSVCVCVCQCTANRRGKSGSSDRCSFLGLQITVSVDCSHEIKRCLLLGRKAMTNLDSGLKIRDITLPKNVHIVKAMVFPVVICGCESWTIKKAEVKWKWLSYVHLFATSWTI